MKYFKTLCFIVFCYSKVTFAQQTDNTIILPGIIVNGDTIPNIQSKPILILPSPTFKRDLDFRKFRKLVINIKIVYPYAKLSKILLDDVKRAMDSIHDKKAQNTYIKAKEKQLMARYSDELKALTITQGKLLIKLVDRELNRTTYDIIKELRGSFQAFFWQQLAFVFGSDLKTQYDPKGDDKIIEQIVIMIDNGQL